jgi:peptidyl-prolyl cis-trans isomerase B (cyclophilin B)
VPSSKQRKDAAKRHLERQLQRRAQQEARRRRFTLIASIVGTLVVAAIVVVFLVAVTDDDKGSSAVDNPRVTTSPGATTSAATGAPGSCDFATSGTAARKVTPPTSPVPTSGKVDVRVATDEGDLTLTLNRASAPCTVASFVGLVQQKYYDKTPCHRLVTSGIYVLQCGDPTGTGTGGPGYTVPDEATGDETYPAGTVAMARTSAPNSGGSQFFIVYKDSPNLAQHLGAQQYTVFGKVSSGLDTVTKVAAGGVQGGGTDGKPKLATTITSMRVVK